jgi:hypothetical protein
MADLLSFAPPVILAVIIAVGALALWDIFRRRRSALPTGDERTRRAAERAAFYALYVGWYFNLALMWVLFLGSEWFGFPEVGAQPALIASLLVSSSLFVMLWWHFGKKENL